MKPFHFLSLELDRYMTPYTQDELQRVKTLLEVFADSMSDQAQIVVLKAAGKVYGSTKIKEP